MKSYDVKFQKMHLSVNLVIPFIIAKENVGKHFVFVTACLEPRFQSHLVTGSHLLCTLHDTLQ